MPEWSVRRIERGRQRRATAKGAPGQPKSVPSPETDSGVSCCPSCSANLLPAVRSDLVRLAHGSVPGELLVVTEIVVGRAVGQKGDYVAADTQHLRHPELAVVAIRRAIVLGPEGVVVLPPVVYVDAAVTGVFVHGLAGDFAADEITPRALIAGDLIDFLPEVFEVLE